MAALKNSSTRRFIAAESDSLTIETIQVESRTHRQNLRILKLKGIWRANENNELCFEATGLKGPPQKFVLKGSWKLNKNNEIVYSSEDGKDTLVFKGHWNLNSGDRIVYFLEGSSLSRFEFKVQIESASFYPKKGEIRYRIGVSWRKSSLHYMKDKLVFYGEWKFGRNLALIFNMRQRGGRVQVIEFGADLSFKPNSIRLSLKNELGEPLGLSLTLTHKFMKALDAKAFIKLEKLRKGHAVEAGLSIPF